MKTTVYQTVEYCSNTAKLKREAPFLCEDDPQKLKEWLGSGYYFWDTFIELAHWWGRVHYKSRKHKDYTICESVLKCNEDEILDLVGNLEQVKDVREIVSQMKDCPEYEDEAFSAQTVINYIRNILKQSYRAIRAYGINSSSDNEITN